MSDPPKPSILKRQGSAIIIGTFSTVASLYFLAGIIPAGINRWFESNRFSVDDTFRGIPNPGGSAAFGVVFAFFVAALCWWSVLSDWRETRASQASTSTIKPNKSEQDDA